MKTTQITVGGRIKFNLGPFELEAVVINDNLGVVIHAFTPKQEAYKIENIQNKDNHLPFSTELSGIWDDIRKDEEIKKLADKFPVTLKGLTIARTRVPVLYELKDDFFKGSESRELKLYCNSKNDGDINAGVIFEKKSFFEFEPEISDTVIKGSHKKYEFELPSNLVSDGKVNIKPYELIPLRVKGDTESSFYPLYDSIWEIELDIAVASNKKKKVVVLNPKYEQERINNLNIQKEIYKTANKETIKWDFSPFFNYITQSKMENVSLRELFLDTDFQKIVLNIVLKEIQESYVKELNVKKEKIETEIKEEKDKLIKGFDEVTNSTLLECYTKKSNLFEQLLNEIKEKPLPIKEQSQVKLITADLIYSFIKDKIEGKSNISADIVECLSKTNEEHTTLFVKYKAEYITIDNTINTLINSKLKEKDFEYKTKKLKDKIDDIESKIKSSASDVKTDLLNFLNNSKTTIEINLFNTNKITKTLNDKKDKKVKDWIEENKNKLAKNDEKPSFPKDKETPIDLNKTFQSADALYQQFLSPKEKASYDFEQFNIKNKYVLATTNEFEDLLNLHMWTPGNGNLLETSKFGELRELQFKFKRTISDQFRNKLSEIYNKNDVFESKILTIEKSIEAKEKEIAAKEKEIAEKTAAAAVKKGELQIIKSNNNYYKKLIIDGVKVIKNRSENYIQQNTHYTSCILFSIELTEDNFKDVFEFSAVKSYKDAVEGLLKINELENTLKENLNFVLIGISNIQKEDNATANQTNNESIEDVELKKLSEQKASLDRVKFAEMTKKGLAARATSDSEKIIKLSDHPELALHPDWFDDKAKKIKFPTLQDRVATALKEFGKS